MASVSSLDQDMRKLRLGRYTPQAANEIRTWIESVLGERLPAGDILEALKDGTALCKLINLAVPAPGVKYKKSPMPFIQMENISHFLRACEQPPLNLPAHDRFLTVDLYEAKDPAQVLQCLGAFSRVANSLNPRNFPNAIGPKKSGGMQSPKTTGDHTVSGYDTNRAGAASSMSTTSYRGGSNTFNPMQRAVTPQRTGGSTSSKATDETRSPPGGVSSWSKKADEKSTTPAWNIHQYGYMGGASQGNQGISFGARRQITTPGPKVPSLTEKEKIRKDREAEEQRQQALAEEAESRRRREIAEEEERERIEEERRWEETTARRKEEEKRRVDAQKKEWEEQERRWKADEEQRRREEEETQRDIEKETERKRATNDAHLHGQFLSQYQAEQSSKPRSRRNSTEDPVQTAERDRVRELERQLEEAKERERQYLAEREERADRRTQRTVEPTPRSRSRSKPAAKERTVSPRESDVSWVGDEREYLRNQWTEQQQKQPQRPLPEPTPARPSTPPSLPVRPLPEPATTVASPPSPSRPLPDPSTYKPPPAQPRSPFAANRTSKFLASNPAPVAPKPDTFSAPDHALSSAAENALESQRRMQAQQKTKAGGWASKSLLEREMERERERQKEWEDAQEEKKGMRRDEQEGAGPGQSWDVNMYGFTGGDSQNKVGSGIGFGGRRQIIGPRPKP
ncbi:hypothetical protein EJ05DRAFT_531590 [Pseudovirgaria hyperparasitica]|uniref:Calponin-homology (CH) domain-containing protein n=1 Tax=Pseudovirgaria hyperparasitica TaxID=470096 RepID=A0A6A6W8A2_9PEZI|nr:uncharacterized protein EJ05DRAFT_531590 [Pseudovirgaria hyperparasitica]KAF2758439.1 hypothetical protein EJ05DRAFT_531590 [Pseudovirgaria hyperparasitica]